MVAMGLFPPPCLPLDGEARAIGDYRRAADISESRESLSSPNAARCIGTYEQARRLVGVSVGRREPPAELPHRPVCWRVLELLESRNRSGADSYPLGGERGRHVHLEVGEDQQQVPFLVWQRWRFHRAQG